jgi:hypothetical protein
MCWQGNPQYVVVMMGGVLAREPLVGGGNDRRCAERGTPSM